MARRVAPSYFWRLELASVDYEQSGPLSVDRFQPNDPIAHRLSTNRVDKTTSGL